MTILTLPAALLLVLVLPAAAGVVLLSEEGTGTRAGSSRPAGSSDPTPPDLVLAQGLACGLATWLIGSGVLAQTVGLSATTAWAWEGLVGAASVVVLALPRHRERAAVVLRVAGRRLAEVGGLTALVYLPMLHTMLHTSWSPLGSTPWYYYGLARQVADAGSVPATSLEFGTATPFLNDYHLFTTGTALLLRQHPGGPMAVVLTLTVLAVLFLGLGTTALTTALGAGRLPARLAVPIVLATGIAAVRLVAYRPEGFALGLTTLMAAAAVDWLRRGDRGSLVAAALLAATLSQVHGIAAITGGVMIGSAALVLLVRGRREAREGRVAQLRRTGLVLVALVVAVVAAGLLFREASGTVHAGGLVDQGGIADPTWEFYRAARGWGPSLPPSNGVMVAGALRELYDPLLRWWLLPVALLAAVGLVRTRRSAVTREVVAFVALSLLGLLALAGVFMLGWHGYVPRRTGAQRLILEMSLVVPPLVAVGLGGLAAPSPSPSPSPHRRPGAAAVSALLVVALSVEGLLLVGRRADDYAAQAPSRRQLATWRSIPATRSDVILANGYTEGFIPDLTGARGLLDGRAPYTFGSLLLRANGLLQGAQTFFRDPARHWSYLAANDVTWVVVADRYTFGLGTANIWGRSGEQDNGWAVRRLAACPGVRQTLDQDGLAVFRVVDSGPTGC